MHLSWIATVSQTRYRGRLGLSDRQYHAFVREWKDSEEGRRLLEGLRWAFGGWEAGCCCITVAKWMLGWPLACCACAAHSIG